MRADACTAKRSARQLARGWKSPPPPRRERRTEGAAESPEDKAPGVETPVTLGGVGEAEVEVEVRPAPEEMEE